MAFDCGWESAKSCCSGWVRESGPVLFLRERGGIYAVMPVLKF